jgi:hypothetical protein
LVLACQAFRRPHDLEELAQPVPSVYPELGQQIEAVRHLSDWGIAYRYPGLEDPPEPLPETEELERNVQGVRRESLPAHRRRMSGSALERLPW